MSPAPSRRHQQISMELGRQISTFLVNKSCEVYSAPFDVRLPEANEIDEEVRTVVQPDVVVICDPQKLDDAGCRGTPDLVVEILSPATAHNDMKIKLALDEKHGIWEFWVVHPEDKIVMTFTPGPDNRYGRPAVYSASDKNKTDHSR